MEGAMQILNQIGHIQHWGISPAVNFLSHWQQKQADNTIRVLLTGTSDIRHILKTLADISIEDKLHPKKIQIYFHETNKELISRALLFLHIIHQTNLNIEQRVQLYLDLYGNALIKQRNSRYIDHLRNDFLNFIHGQKKKINTPLTKFVSLKMLKFQQRDEISEFIQSWSNKVEFDMQKLRDQRMRYLFKQRYDYRANLCDWDFNMLLSEYAPLIHFYHYKEWRLIGLAFQQRFSTYTEPNRTLASYVSGRKKQERTSCLVRGYWGDLMISPFVAMGIDTNSEQKDLLFKKANMKYVGHAVQLTQYNLTYWITRIQTGKTYHKHFRDYYRTDEEGRKKLEEDKKKNQEKKKNLKQIKQEEQEEVEKEDQKDEKEEQIKDKQQEEITQQLKNKQDQDLDSEEEERKKQVTRKNKQDIKTVLQLEEDSKEAQILEGIRRYGVQFLPLCTPTETLTSKQKFKNFFDIAVIGFFHSASMNKQIQSTIKDNGLMYVEKSRYVVPKRKEERKELDQKIKVLGAKDGFKLAQDTTDYLIFKKETKKE